MELLLHFQLLCLLAVYSLVVKKQVLVKAGAAWWVFVFVGVIYMGENMSPGFYRYADGISCMISIVVILRLRKYILSNHEKLRW